MKRTILMSALALFAISALSIQNVEAQDVKKKATSTQQTTVNAQTAAEKDVLKPTITTATKEVKKDKACCDEKKMVKDEKAKKECCADKDMKKAEAKKTTDGKADHEKRPAMKQNDTKKKAQTKQEKINK